MRAAADLANTEVERLRELAPPITAAGIGGSLGRGDADINSDVDVFVFFDDGDVFTHAHWLLNKVKSDLAAISIGPVKFFAGYGICLSFVLTDLQKLEYFINTPSTWTRNPMRANTVIRFDLTGRYSQLLSECTVHDLQQTTKQLAMSDVLHDLLLEALNLAKYARRRDAWSMHYRVAAVRRQLVALLLAIDETRPFDVQTAMAHTNELAPEQAVALAGTVPSASVVGMADALRELSVLAGHVARQTPTASDPRWHSVIETLSRARATLLL